MVNGARTLKCYGWEQHYINKISTARNNQKKELLKIGIVGFLGIAFF